jgi:hypothetical protein
MKLACWMVVTARADGSYCRCWRHAGAQRLDRHNVFSDTGIKDGLAPALARVLMNGNAP